MKRYPCFARKRMRVGLALSGLLSVWIAIAGVSAAYAQGANVTVVNAASFAFDAIAPESLAAAFGSFNTTGGGTFTAQTQPLPTTLGGVRVTVGGIDCGLIVVSPGQINFVTPALAANGSTPIVVTNADGSQRNGVINAQRAAPGIFTARGNGLGAPAALLTLDGANFQAAYNPDGSERELILGPRDRNTYLILFATGVRNAPAVNPNDDNGVGEAVTATIQGVPATVAFAGRVSGFQGMDQINLVIPPELSGIGQARIRLRIGDRAANTVTIRIGGQAPPIRAQDIQANSSVIGELAATDQVQDAGDGTGRTYFFDAYRLRTTAANTTVAVDLRSAQFDAATAIYRQNTDGSLVLLTADDQTGAMGNGIEENGNALALTVLRNAGDYLILVTSANGEPDAIGGYTLSVRTGVIQQLSYSATPVAATISGSDLQTSAGDFLDAYWFAGTAGDLVQIRMNSTAFDSFLILDADNGDLVDFDDNSGGALNALVTRTLQRSGVYIIIATPYAPARTGAYTLTLNRLNGLVAGSDELYVRAPGRQWSQRREADETQFERFASRRRLAPDE